MLRSHWGFGLFMQFFPDSVLFPFIPASVLCVPLHSFKGLPALQVRDYSLCYLESALSATHRSVGQASAGKPVDRKYQVYSQTSLRGMLSTFRQFFAKV